MTEQWQPKKLRPRHSEIIRLCHEGMTNVRISEMVGISSVAVGLILRSPLAQAELARLKDAADLKSIDTPLRVRAALELDRAALESLRFNAELVKDPLVDKKLRARVATHFLDRVVFDKDPLEQEGSYREILRSLNVIEKQMADRPVPIVYDIKKETENGEATVEATLPDATETEEEGALNSDDVEYIRFQRRLPEAG